MRECEVCGTTVNVEKHHCVFRSQSKIMATMSINLKDLCSRCHRGRNSPHKDKKVDNQYKLEVQNKLKNILSKDHYSIDGLKKALKINNRQAKYIEKNIRPEREGYCSEDVIRYLMGGRLYE